MTFRCQVYFWSAVVCGLLAFIFIFNEVLFPFVLGAAVAYLLNPVVEGFARRGMKRGWAVGLISGVFFVLVALFLVLMVPFLSYQVLQFLKEVPLYYQRALDLALPYFSRYGVPVTGQSAGLSEWMQDHMGAMGTVAGSVMSSLVAGGQAFFHVISACLLTPVAAYFFLLEWPALCHWGEEMLPRRRKVFLLGLLQKMDEKVSAFIRGQIMVALFLAVFYAVCLAVAGLPYGFLIGLSAGLVSIVPFAGPLLGGAVGVGMAWAQSGEWSYVALIGSVFVTGQIIEGNVLTPRLVGDRVGLHPLWVFFSLMAGGRVCGFLGVFLAIPVAAILSVLLSALISFYRGSPYYGGDVSLSKQGVEEGS